MPQANATSDAAWWQGDPAAAPSTRATGFVRHAQTVVLKDATRIAVYVHLPASLAPGERLPTVMMLTPYFSVARYRHPLFAKLMELLAPPGNAKWAEALVPYGFAVVLMDLRGSGRSSGRKRMVGLPDAAKDGAEVIDWIVAQPWSNGSVGATGISGVGLAAMWLATSRHPALKAIAPRFTAFDMYAATHPGGLCARTFMQEVGVLLRAIDSNRLHEMPQSRVARLVLRLMVHGIEPADDDPEEIELARAVADHAGNEHPEATLIAIEHRDDVLPGTTDATLDTQSPFAHAEVLRNSGVAVYGFAGWLDAAFTRDLVALHNTVRTPGSKLVIGPWGHGARFYCSPFVDGRRRSEFDQAAEMARFFAHHLSGEQNGIEREPAVHYFTIGAERWRSSDVWPPPGGSTLTLRFAAEGRLDRGDASAETASDMHRFDMRAASGVNSRFGRHLAGGRFPARYPDRARRDATLLTYTSPPLESALEVTGHPLVRLHVSSDVPDGAFFVYLEDVAPDGRVRNATDGMLRASARKTVEGGGPYWTSGPWRTNDRADAEPMRPGEVAELRFDLLPVSHRFAAGHAIRVAIAGADVDNFKPVIAGTPAPTIRLHRGGRYDSRIELPIARAE